jgi:hypothetical protein
MACSKYFLDTRNITNNSSILNTNYSSSNNIDLGNNLQKKKEWFELPIEAETYPQEKGKEYTSMVRISGGIRNHLTVLNRELPNKKA